MNGKIRFLAIAALAALTLPFAAACAKGNGGGTQQGGGDGSQNTQPEQPDKNPSDGSDENPPAASGGIVTLPSRINIDIDDGALELPYILTGGNGPIEWKSDYSSVAVVDKNGKLYPVTEGTTTITAKTSSFVTTFEVNVTDEYGAYTKISTVEDFENLAVTKAYTNGKSKFCLANDIDFGGKAIQPLGGWGDSKNAFKGIFDGRGYALKNFKIVNPESCKEADGDSGAAFYFGVSLFPNVNGGRIRNLSLVNAEIKGNGFSGGIAGQLESGTIENCYINGTVNATDGFTKSIPAGGICGIMGAKAVVKDVFLDADVLGGFVFAGFNFGTGSNCAVRENAVTALREGETLMFCTDDTGNGNEEENKQLKEFDEQSCLILKDSKLTALRNYPFSMNSNWAVMSGYNAFVARADGTAPDWAKNSVK